MKFPYLLPNLLITEVEPSPFRIRDRLVGIKFQDILNVNLTGRYLAELIGNASHTPWMDHFAEAANRQIGISTTRDLPLVSPGSVEVRMYQFETRYH